MTSSPATVTDLTSRSLRTLTTAETAWAGTRLGDAFNQILIRLPTVATRLDAAGPSSPYGQLVTQVQVAMVLRVLANPDYVRQQSVDDSTTILDQAVSSGALYVSDDEVALLTAGNTTTGGAWTIRARPTQPAWYLDPAAAFTGTMGNIL